MEESPTEIRTFYSTKEIHENIEAQIIQHKTLAEDYSQWLGMLLRKPESSHNQEWIKKTAELQKLLKTSGKKVNKKEDKNLSLSTEWAQFRDIMLSADAFAEAEILFEAIEELKSKIGELEKARNSIIDLERHGLGKDLLFITYVLNGVPKKIVFKPKDHTEFADKFEFTRDFTIVQQTASTETE